MSQFNFRTLGLMIAFIAVALSFTSYFLATTNWDVYVAWDSTAGEWRKREFSTTEAWLRCLGLGIGFSALLFLGLIAIRRTFRLFSTPNKRFSKN